MAGGSVRAEGGAFAAAQITPVRDPSLPLGPRPKRRCAVSDDPLRDVGSAGVSEVVVVTGSSSGIGRAVAERFAGDGARVIVNSSRSVEEGEMLARSLPDAVYVQGDVSREEDARRLVATALERFGQLDVVVNNAGTTRRVPFADLEAADDELWWRILGVNLMGPWYLSRAAVPALRRRRGRSSTWDRSRGSSRAGARSRTQSRRRRCITSREPLRRRWPRCAGERGRAGAGRDALDGGMGGKRGDRRPDSPWSRRDARGHRGCCRLTRSHAVCDRPDRRCRRRADLT